MFAASLPFYSQNVYCLQKMLCNAIARIETAFMNTLSREEWLCFSVLSLVILLVASFFVNIETSERTRKHTHTQALFVTRINTLSHSELHDMCALIYERFVFPRPQQRSMVHLSPPPPCLFQTTIQLTLNNMCICVQYTCDGLALSSNSMECRLASDPLS